MIPSEEKKSASMLANSPSFKKNTRANSFPCRRLSQLQDEVEELRRKPTRSANPGPSPGAHVGAHEEVQEQLQASPVLSDLAPVGFGPSTSGPTLAAEGDAADRTTPQTLNGVEITGEEIDDLFQMYV